MLRSVSQPLIESELIQLKTSEFLNERVFTRAYICSGVSMIVILGSLPRVLLVANIKSTYPITDIGFRGRYADQFGGVTADAPCIAPKRTPPTTTQQSSTFPPFYIPSLESSSRNCNVTAVLLARGTGTKSLALLIFLF